MLGLGELLGLSRWRESALQKLAFGMGFTERILLAFSASNMK